MLIVVRLNTSYSKRYRARKTSYKLNLKVSNGCTTQIKATQIGARASHLQLNVRASVPTQPHVPTVVIYTRMLEVKCIKSKQTEHRCGKGDSGMPNMHLYVLKYKQRMQVRQLYALVRARGKWSIGQVNVTNWVTSGVQMRVHSKYKHEQRTHAE